LLLQRLLKRVGMMGGVAGGKLSHQYSPRVCQAKHSTYRHSVKGKSLKIAQAPLDID
jgi:hypothetical protein